MNKPKFPLWDQFVEDKSSWIGGLLTDHDSMMGDHSTIIKDICLEEIGGGWAFCVEGHDFGCSFNVENGGISGRPIEDQSGKSLNFWVYGGLSFTIEKP